jgi:hypothetical protein
MTARQALPGAFLLILAGVFFWLGPIPQLPHYHEFADQRSWAGIPHAADVLSNLAYLCAGLWGFALMPPARSMRALDPIRFSCGLFFFGLIATALGSGWYHLAPDDCRLLADRLPIALACAALLAWQARAYMDAPRCVNGLLVAFAIFSVAWWGLTKDLRPYLFLQVAALLAIPLLHHCASAPRAERIAFVAAGALYAIAKLCEAADQSIFSMFPVSGHTLKHLLSAAAALVLVAEFRRQRILAAAC